MVENKGRFFTRKMFLKAFVPLVAGTVVGDVMVEPSVKISREVEKVTHARTGNAQVYVEAEKLSGEGVAPDELNKRIKQEFAPSVGDVIIWASEEETLTRALPSAIISGDSGKNRWDEVIFGMNNIRVTRKEFVTGVISSLIFGIMHNFTEKGFDTKTIPASQTAGGMVLWYLQRKLGVISNITAHSVYNLRLAEKL